MYEKNDDYFSQQVFLTFKRSAYFYLVFIFLASMIGSYWLDFIWFWYSFFEY